MEFSGPGPAYFVAPNQNGIFVTDGLTETLVHSHHNIVRNLAFHPDSDDYLYFSESWGGARDGHIYRLDLRRDDADLFYTIHVGEVGYWAGDFAFDPVGNLYISSGNSIPASLYIYDSGHFLPQYTRNEPIMGFCFEGMDRHALYYVNNGNRLYRLTNFAHRAIEFEARVDSRLSDVAYVTIPDSGTCRIAGHLYGGEPFWPGTMVGARGPNVFWRDLEHARTQPTDHGEYELENLLPGEYYVYTDIASEGWAAFLPSNQIVSCGHPDVDFTMSREGLAVTLDSLECNDAQELTDEVYLIVNGERIWESSMNTGDHRTIGRSFTFHEDNVIEVWEEDWKRDDRIGTLRLTYEDAITLIREHSGPYTQRFHRDRWKYGDATYTLHYDIN
jgi:WD40 repeat protein